MSRLVLVPIMNSRDSKSVILKDWRAGKAFRILDASNFVSIKSVHIHKEIYSSVVIQYDKGVIEV